jgi:hypothetical protein
MDELSDPRKGFPTSAEPLSVSTVALLEAIRLVMWGLVCGVTLGLVAAAIV